MVAIESEEGGGTIVIYVLVFFAGEAVAFAVVWLVSRATPTDACLEARCDWCARLGRDCAGNAEAMAMAERDLAEWKRAGQTWNRRN